MSAWPQQQNGIFPGMLDASNQQNAFDPAAMSQMYGGAGINPAQFANPQMQQRMPNGTMHPQAAFQNQNFGVGQVVPSKRSSDGMVMSPGPGQNQNNASRSQTPMQPGTPFQGGQPGQQFPNPYQHLQQANSADASPSPTIQNQQFRPPQQPPQRMTSQSPANFPQMNVPPGQMSPTTPTSQQQPQQPQQAMSMSPQPQQQNFSPNLGGGQGFGQPFPNQAMMQAGMPGGMHNMNAAGMNPAGMNMTAEAQMQARMQQRQYQLMQQARMQAMGRGMPGQMGGPMSAQMAAQMGQQFPGGMPQRAPSMANGQQQSQVQQQQQQQQPHTQPQQQQQQGQGQPQGQQPGQPGQPGQQAANPQEKARMWLASLAASLQAQGKPFNANPPIAGRNVNLYMLWVCIVQLGGSQRVNAMNGWTAVATKLGFPNNPTAAQEIKNAFEMYISGYEKQAYARQAQRSAAAAQMNARQGLNASQGSPTRATHGTPQDAQQAQQAQLGNAMPQQGHQQPQQGQPMGAQNQMQQQQNQLQRPGSQMQNGMPMAAMPGQQMQQQGRQASIPRQDSVPPQMQEASPAPGIKGEPQTPGIKREPSVVEDKREYVPQKKVLEQTHGGYPVDAVFWNTKEIAAMAHESVRAQTMFFADIKALTLSLESGIASEVRYAIDTIADLTSKTVYWKDGPHARQPIPGVVILDKCGDLLDAVLDSIEEHLDFLSPSEPPSDNLILPTYEDLLRLSRGEHDYLRDDVEAGTKEHALLNAADRLIALLGIISNLSMDQFNQAPLATSNAVTLIANAIGRIGSRPLFLRSNENTLDFYKLVVVFLSNVAGTKLELQSREEATNILYFILAFAPQPPPSLKQGQAVEFVGYNPGIHRYMPPAVDALAKILARQEPNRSFYRTIFSAPSSAADSIRPLDLLTRAFGLAVAFLPDRTKGPLLFDAEINLLKLRKAYLAQGMLAADILASLIPTPSSSESQTINVARAWLEADSRWPASLVRMAFLFSTSPKVNENLLEMQHRPLRRDHLGQVMRDRQNMALFDETNDVPGMIANRSLRMLLRLVEIATANTRPGKHGLSSHKPKLPAATTNGNDDVTTTDGHTGSNGATENGDDADDSDVESSVGLLIPGDPIPKRETITALLGTPQSVDTEAIRTMDKLYDLIIPRA